MADIYLQAKEKALRSRDKLLVHKIRNLEKEQGKELDKLEKEAEKSMDPKLRREWKQIHKEYSKLFLFS